MQEVDRLVEAVTPVAVVGMLAVALGTAFRNPGEPRVPELSRFIRTDVSDRVLASDIARWLSLNSWRISKWVVAMGLATEAERDRVEKALRTIVEEWYAHFGVQG
jgi:hypothetical protein